MKVINSKPSLNLHTVLEGVIFDPRDSIPKFKKHNIRQDPVYMCDIVSPQNMYVMIANCYQIDDKSLKEYQQSQHSPQDVGKLTKAHKTEYDIEEPYGRYPITKLSKAAKALYDKHPDTGYQVDTKPAVFSAIVSHGTDTFSHKQEDVIAERLPSKQVYNAKKHRMHTEPGRLTGVKIGLADNFFPIRKYTPTKYVLSQLTHDSNSILGMYLGF